MGVVGVSNSSSKIKMNPFQATQGLMRDVENSGFDRESAPYKELLGEVQGLFPPPVRVERFEAVGDTGANPLFKMVILGSLGGGDTVCLGHLTTIGGTWRSDECTRFAKPDRFPRDLSDGEGDSF